MPNHKLASEPSPKALGAAAGGGVGAALALLTVWLLREAGLEPPDGVEAALAVILGAVVSYAGGWLPRDPLRDRGALATLQDQQAADAARDATDDAGGATSAGWRAG